jgi:hypothetical protein
MGDRKSLTCRQSQLTGKVGPKEVADFANTRRRTGFLGPLPLLNKQINAASKPLEGLHKRPNGRHAPLQGRATHGGRSRCMAISSTRGEVKSEELLASLRRSSSTSCFVYPALYRRFITSSTFLSPRPLNEIKGSRPPYHACFGT